MKRLFSVSLLACVLLAACTKNMPTAPEPEPGAANAPGLQYASIPIGNPNTGLAAPYIVLLESRVNNGDGTWTWTWSIRNVNPGNGLSGTAQDLSHWNMSFGSCVNPASFRGAAVSMDGSRWSAFVPTVATDPSQQCQVAPVLKFDVGTSGGNKTWCRLTVAGDYGVDYTSVGSFKSGKRTGCGLVWYAGIGCNAGSVLD